MTNHLTDSHGLTGGHGLTDSHGDTATDGHSGIPTDDHNDTGASLLAVRGLSVSYRTRTGPVHAVQGVDLDIRPGEIVALVGESGSGKSTTAHAIVGLLPAGGRIDAGSVRFGGHDLAALSERELRAIRGARIGLIPQDPTVSLNPVKRIGAQVAEVLRIHRLATRRSAPLEAIALLERADCPNRRSAPGSTRTSCPAACGSGR
nr:ATP-binding cassette domain-containing protein [Candidatus Protofrankia californiensis]